MNYKINQLFNTSFLLPGIFIFSLIRKLSKNTTLYHQIKENYNSYTDIIDIVSNLSSWNKWLKESKFENGECTSVA